jgi:hypothetical protein
MMNWSEKILEYHFGLNTDLPIPEGIEWIYPFDEPETRQSMTSFYSKYFDDNNERTFLLGINPGRFGAGVTGIPFTDPKKLQEVCGIKNDFHKRAELSSNFVYSFIEALGGPDVFYRSFYITSLCPLGFIKDGKNYNYYDSAQLQASVTPLIIDNIRTQLDFGGNREVAYSMGKGKNFKYLKQLNNEHGFFKSVQHLPHPRWVMQYKLKSMSLYLDEYVAKLSSWLH